MPRRGDNRSPSPAGSYASSKRSRRDDDRHPADRKGDSRSYRRRSRSPGYDRRYRDRDRDHRDSYTRPDRSPDRRLDRHDGDSNRSARHERSRERNRSSDRAIAKDSRRRSRDRNHRDRREDSRDRHKRRRDDSRDDRRAAPSSRQPSDRVHESSRATASHQPIDEVDKQAQRRAKMQAWKEAQAKKETRIQAELDTSSGNHPRPNEIGGRTNRSPLPQPSKSLMIPQSSSTLATTVQKEDIKAIAPGSSLAKDKAIGSVHTKSVSRKVITPDRSPITALSLANKSKAASSKLNSFAPVGDNSQKKGTVVTNRFELGNKQQLDNDGSTAKRGLDLGDEESTRKKLERLPDLPIEEANGVDESQDIIENNEEEEDLENAGTEEEQAAAARAAAEKREERLRAENDTAMEDVVTDQAIAEDTQKNENENADKDEIDPLDAFMTGLSDGPKIKASGKRTIASKTAQTQEPEAMFGDDDDDFTTMNGAPDDYLELANKVRKKKDVPTVNHAKMNYDPFRKNFYTEPLELVSMSEEELADLRLELDGIKVRGMDIPKPVIKWSQFGLGVQSLDVIHKLGYERPTSIQAQAIPTIMSGRDAIGIAKTGSGKTMAFLLPMFRHIKDQKPLSAMDGPIGLVMAPTRELATQIHKECKPWLKALNLRAVCCYGGAPIKDQIADLKRGAEIIVCTAGRMVDLLAANSGRVTNLRRVTYVVLDEADRMFDMGFEPQVMKIMGNIRPEKQTVLFSATFPRNMEALARKALIKPIEIIVGGRSVVAPEIKQVVEVRSEDSKFVRLLQLLGETHEDDDARSLIFVDRQESAEDLMSAILKRGYPCFTIHGAKDQSDRDSVISDFKAGIFPVLVATSVAARGLDVKQLKMVVNFDCPNHLEDYVHRAGRTGRAGNTGLAVTFITEDQARYSVDIAKALKQSGQEVPVDLEKLVEVFKERVKAGKEKVSGSGFGGKGLERLDDKRDLARKREMVAFPTGDGNEQVAKTETEDETNDEVIAKPVAASTATAPPAALPGVPDGFDLDGPIQIFKSEPPPPGTKLQDRMKGVSDAAAAINARLRKQGDIRGNAPIDNKGPDAGLFHSILEINDFPQKARWAVTNRTNVAKILESTGTSITTKGNFYPTGSMPGPNDAPKLNILVEGDTELAVDTAMRELRRLLKDGVIAAAESEARAPASGRYSVV